MTPSNPEMLLQIPSDRAVKRVCRDKQEIFRSQFWRIWTKLQILGQMDQRKSKYLPA